MTVIVTGSAKPRGYAVPGKWEINRFDPWKGREIRFPKIKVLP